MNSPYRGRDRERIEQENISVWEPVSFPISMGRSTSRSHGKLCVTTSHALPTVDPRLHNGPRLPRLIFLAIRPPLQRYAGRGDPCVHHVGPQLRASGRPSNPLLSHPHSLWAPTPHLYGWRSMNPASHRQPGSAETARGCSPQAPPPHLRTRRNGRNGAQGGRATLPPREPASRHAHPRRVSDPQRLARAGHPWTVPSSHLQPAASRSAPRKSCAAPSPPSTRL